MRHERIDRFTWRIVRRKVKQLIGRVGFTQQDREDLEHEMILRLLQALPSFDAEKAHRNVFITTVLERYTANILRNKRAEKRNCRHTGSLHEMIDIGEEAEVELAQLVSQRELDARRGCHPRSNEELALLAQDLADRIAKLPQELRALAERLKTQSISGVARDLDLPRTTLRARTRHIGQQFQKAGLKKYF